MASRGPSGTSEAPAQNLPSLLSVEPVENGSARDFRLNVEADFVKGLSDPELLAAVAHELGHVWIEVVRVQGLG